MYVRIINFILHNFILPNFSPNIMSQDSAVWKRKLFLAWLLAGHRQARPLIFLEIEELIFYTWPPYTCGDLQAHTTHS